MRKLQIEGLNSKRSSSIFQEKEHDTSRSRNKENFAKKHLDQHQKTMRVINLAHNLKDTTSNLLKDLKCTCAAKKQIEILLVAYAQKIQRIRQQRNKYRTRAKQLRDENQLLMIQKTSSENYVRQFSDKSSDNDSGSKRRHQVQVQSRLNLKIRFLEQELKLQRQLNQRYKTQSKSESLLDDKKFQEMQVQNDQLINQNNFLKKLNFDLQKKLKQLEDSFQQLQEVRSKQVKDQRPQSLISKDEIQMWQLANKLGEQSWQRRLQAQIKHLCEKKQNLRVQQKQLKQRERNF